MAMSHYLLPLSEEVVRSLRNGLTDYWNGIDPNDDLTGVLRGRVRETEIRVTELLETGRDEDLLKACRLTAEFEWNRNSG